MSDDSAEFGDRNFAVLAALKRAHADLEDASLPEIQEYLRGLDESQVRGLVSNVKGVLHEMEFVRLENEDGDSVYASFFESTNHPDNDIVLIDKNSGDVWEVQLKATDSASYVEAWIGAHPGGEILVTDELAERMELPTTGQLNGQLTADVEEFVDKLLAAEPESDFWDYVPALAVSSIAVAVWGLWRRYGQGEIDWFEFKSLAARVTGLKVGKIGIIGLLLSMPVVGQVTGALLVARLLLNSRGMLTRSST